MQYRKSSYKPFGFAVQCSVCDIWIKLKVDFLAPSLQASTLFWAVRTLPSQVRPSDYQSADNWIDEDGQHEAFT